MVLPLVTRFISTTAAPLPGNSCRESAVFPIGTAPCGCGFGHGLLNPPARLVRGVAQPGRVPALGAGCRWFESSRPDHRLRNELWSGADESADLPAGQDGHAIGPGRHRQMAT